MDINIVEAGNYRVMTGAVFPELEKWLADQHPTKVFLFMDENTKKYCFPVLQEQHTALAKRAVKIVVDSGEKNKTLNTCSYLWEQLTNHQADRRALIINLSGGVLSDMGGFVAATYKRGIRFINMPTTLLSMVDASVGGKLGVDFKGYKNHIGLFADPGAVFIFPPFLKTLPRRQIKSGMAEIFKHGLISAEDYFKETHYLLQNGDLSEGLPSLVPRSVAIKQSFVVQDPEEANIRKVLNFGHTIGHALEAWSFATESPLLHGEAIAQGMLVELLLSMTHARLPEKQGNYAIQVLMEHYSTLRLSESAVEQIIVLMKQDKKNSSGKVLFSLLDEIGEPVYDVPVEEKGLREAFHHYNRLL